VRERKEENERAVSCLQFIQCESFDQLPYFLLQDAVWKSAFFVNSCRDVIAEVFSSVTQRFAIFNWLAGKYISRQLRVNNLQFLSWKEDISTQKRRPRISRN